jgi:hypothetical protein
LRERNKSIYRRPKPFSTPGRRTNLSAKRNRLSQTEKNLKYSLAIANSLKTLRVEFEEIGFFSGRGVLTPSEETNPCERNQNLQTVKKKESKPEREEHRQKNKQPVHNKRYSKCGYWWSFEHLESLPTFVLA